MKKNIAVIHGGVGQDRHKSVEYGKTITKIFRDVGNNVVEIHLHPNGSWTRDGKVENLENALTGMEHAWNALVGEEGENGLVEKLCHKCHVKIIGHKSLHTDLAADKKKLKDVLKQHKIKTPYSKVLHLHKVNSEDLKHAYQMVGLPALVKPLKGSSGRNIFFVNNFKEYTNAVENIFASGHDVLVEKPIVGKHISCFVFAYKGNLHAHVYSDVELEREEFMQVRNEALFIHNSLAFNHHVKYDFVLQIPPLSLRSSSTPSLYFLEANTHPSLLHDEIDRIFKKGEVSLSEYLINRVS
jgi:D-alanine-D-alanine ligase-like ATP-grasp enzyme